MSKVAVWRDRVLCRVLDPVQLTVVTVEGWMSETRLWLDELVLAADHRLGRNGYERD